MIQFTLAVLGGLTANLSAGILENGLREVKKLFPADPEAGDPEKEALERCVLISGALENLFSDTLSKRALAGGF